jgi:site-specific recombinase XerD
MSIKRLEDNVMSTKYLEISKLIKKVTEELKKLRYTEKRLKKFAPTWDKLKSYMECRKISVLDFKTALDFLEEVYGIKTLKKLSSAKRSHARAVNILNDYQQHGIILTKAKGKIHTYHPQFQDVFGSYIDFKRNRGISEDTLGSYAIYLERFSDYLNSQNICDISQLDSRMVLGFCQTLFNCSPATVHCILCSLRTFFNYLYQQKILSKDFAYTVPRDGYRRSIKVPSTYPKEDIKKLLSSIDRANPKGKRDYAIILLAARLGLRAQDICDLSFSNLRWETNTIEFVQGKTKEPVVLPLLEEVGAAIIDYLKYARPDEKTNTVFLRLVPPIVKLEAPTLHSIVTYHMRRAAIKIEAGKKHGPHALRHSLAKILLEENTPLPVISEILGHTNTNSTSSYLKIDIKQLRECSLEAPPFDWKEVF